MVAKKRIFFAKRRVANGVPVSYPVMAVGTKDTALAVSGVIGNWAFQALQGLDPSPLQDIVLILIWPIAIIAGTIVAVA